MVTGYQKKHSNSMSDTIVDVNSTFDFDLEENTARLLFVLVRPSAKTKARLHVDYFIQNKKQKWMDQII